MTAELSIDAHTGLVSGASYQASPNCDDRPAGMQPELLVVHGISLPPGQFGGPAISALFCNSLDPAEHPFFAEIAHLRVSAHVLIRRDGSLIQYVPLHRRAWHAGRSSYCGREHCNDFSIGVELEGCDDIPYEPVQYRRLVSFVHALQAVYPRITRERIVGHCHIAPGRKSDPGPAFDWQAFFNALDAGD